MTVQAERYTGSDGQTYRLWRAGKDDTTAEHMTYPSGYSPKCDHCYLGQVHSQAAHAAKINDK
jgi:hypothetical protein